MSERSEFSEFAANVNFSSLRNLASNELFLNEVMMNNLDENYIIELVKKELSRYLTDQGIEIKKELYFLGDDNEIKEQLSQKFNFSENAKTLIVSQLSLKNLYNISNAIYENEYEEKIIKFLLENKEIVIIREGIEYSKYENIPVAVQKKYEEYLEKVKS